MKQYIAQYLKLSPPICHLVIEIQPSMLKSASNVWMPVCCKQNPVTFWWCFVINFSSWGHSSHELKQSLTNSICSHYPFDKILALHLGGPKLESSQGKATLTNILFVVLAHPRNLWDNTFKQPITASFPFIIQNHTAKALISIIKLNKARIIL